MNKQELSAKIYSSIEYYEESSKCYLSINQFELANQEINKVSQESDKNQLKELL